MSRSMTVTTWGVEESERADTVIVTSSVGTSGSRSS